MAGVLEVAHAHRLALVGRRLKKIMVRVRVRVRVGARVGARVGVRIGFGSP